MVMPLLTELGIPVNATICEGVAKSLVNSRSLIVRRALVLDATDPTSQQEHIDLQRQLITEETAQALLDIICAKLD